MPRIFDNIELSLLASLTDSLKRARNADFCVGYFNLRGWRQLGPLVEQWKGGDGACCRLLIGMQPLPIEELRDAFSLVEGRGEIDQKTAVELKKQVTKEFRVQLALGAPTNHDEEGLRRLQEQLKKKQVVVKLSVKDRLHAKLYLVHRQDPDNPTTGFLGSSNLTMAGLAKQGELNIDVLDQDACNKLTRWFEDRWTDRWSIEISEELQDIIQTSWARPDPILPYHIYLKIAYHLSQEARAGLSEFRLPREFDNRLLDFQVAAVKIAAHHLNKRGGVLIGDVVGLGKTIMATALAKIFQEDYAASTLIICPKNLVSMWEDYVARFGLAAKVLSLSLVISDLPTLRRYRLVLIDESHNLRNRFSKRFRVIRDYVASNESKCILLSATPYNKTYLDLSAQLRLFVDEEQDIGIRPEKLVREIGETELLKLQFPVRSLQAFELSPYADDWRDLMRLFLIRRTRSFIKDNYAKSDPESGRRYLEFADEAHSRFYFPDRLPKTVKFSLGPEDGRDQYGRLFSDAVVKKLAALALPRYGLGNYLLSSAKNDASPPEVKTIEGLSRAGKRLMGFCRTNLFKRLESSGPAFLLSLRNHALRNFVYLHALEFGGELPIGAQDPELLDTRFEDSDVETQGSEEDEEGDVPGPVIAGDSNGLESERDYRARAAQVYADYRGRLASRFKWVPGGAFTPNLRADLAADAKAILSILADCGSWDPARDSKLNALNSLLKDGHPSQKVLIFSQFADTVEYLAAQLRSRGLDRVAGVTGSTEDATSRAWRFSPVSNEHPELVGARDELRVLISTDVLSEGQNLQDCSVVVNFDLPWAIVRLVQRVGRVDRIGQQSRTVTCYSFLPTEGVERIIRLRARVRQRLTENAEVIGTDETFFEDDKADQPIRDLYNERAGILDKEEDSEVDLASYAYQIWKNAVDRDASLAKVIPELPDVAFSAREHIDAAGRPPGVLVYLRTEDDTDALTWIDERGKAITQSQLAILKAAECTPETTALPRQENHHELVRVGVKLSLREERLAGGQLGRPSGARYRIFDRLKAYVSEVKGTLDDVPELQRAIDDIYRLPLREGATDTLNRQMRAGASGSELAQIVVNLREEGRLTAAERETKKSEPRIVCSLGLVSAQRD